MLGDKLKMSKVYKFRYWDKMHNKMIVNPSIWNIKRTPLNDILSMEDRVYMRSHLVKDRNGKELYEGDIILAWDTFGQPCNGGLPITICEVNYYTNPDNIEIIGNEFENPDKVLYRQRP